MLYDWKCDCGKVLQETFGRQWPDIPRCSCGMDMYRDYRFTINNDPYSKPIHSTSLAINPCQVDEHRQLYPDVKLDKECRPVFENFKQQDAYLQKTGFDKLKW